MEQPLSALSDNTCQQRDRDGSLLPHLSPIWKGMVPEQQVVNHTTYQIGEDADYLCQAAF